jgi:hypothetical protein
MKSKRVKIVGFDVNINHCYMLREELAANGIGCDIAKVDDFESYGNLSGLKRLKEALRKENEEVTVFMPSLMNAELYLEEPDFSIMVSGYSSWYAPNRIKIIPPLWTPSPAPEDSELTEIKWSKKPNLSVGFMGNSFEGSKVATLASYLPISVKRKILEGRHLRHSALIIGCHGAKFPLILVSCFARIEAIRKLEATSLNKDIVKRNWFTGSSEELKNFKNHLKRNTYIFCPRGVENYSFRFYETLSFGRIPVLIDTNMVLPPNVNWDELCVRIPYENISELEKIIRNDYENKTESDFLERQEKALKTMEELRKRLWLKDVIAEIATSAQYSNLTLVVNNDSWEQGVRRGER